MAKKKTRKTKKAFKPVKRQAVTRADWLKHLIKVSEDAIVGTSSVDEFFKNQAERLKKELADLKTKKAA